RDDEHLDAVSNLPAVQHLGGGAQVLNAGVGARAQEDHVHRDVTQWGSWGQVHVLQSALCGGTVGVVGEVLRCGDGCAQRQALARVGSPGDERGEAGSVDVDDRIELRALVGTQGCPVVDRILPVLTLRGVRAALEVVEGRLVWGDHAGSGASLDGQVADGHAGFHRQLLDSLATVLNDVPLAAAGADLRDDGEDQVLGGDPRLQLAADLEDRKSTRLNSSHVSISYAVFCLKKKNVRKHDQKNDGITRQEDVSDNLDYDYYVVTVHVSDHHIAQIELEDTQLEISITE